MITLVISGRFVLAESESGERISIIHIDSGKLKSKAMDTWCDANGYTLQFTAPYMSTHNSHVEHMHLTVMNRMRAMRTSTPDIPLTDGMNLP